MNLWFPREWCDSIRSERVQALAAEWDRAMAAVDLIELHEALRTTIRHLLDWQWDSPP